MSSENGMPATRVHYIVHCPDCENGKIVGLFPKYVEGVTGPPAIVLDCDRCSGTGKIPAEMMEWIEIGNQCRISERGLSATSVHRFVRRPLRLRLNYDIENRSSRRSIYCYLRCLWALDWMCRFGCRIDFPFRVASRRSRHSVGRVWVTIRYGVWWKKNHASID